MSRSYWRLYSGQAVSNLGATFGTFVNAWLVYQITGSTRAMGGLWLITLLAQMAVQFGIGPYLDAVPRKRLMIYSDVIRLIAYAAISLLGATHHLTVWMLFGCTLLTSLVVYDSAANALLPTTVCANQLVKANARMAGIVQLVRFLAMPAAGAVIGIAGAEWALSGTVILFLASVCLAATIREERLVHSGAGWLVQFRKGIGIYRQYPLLLTLGGFIAVTNFAVSATQTLYIPYICQVLGGTSFEYGLFAGCFPLGYIVGSACVSRLRDGRADRLGLMFLALSYGGVSYLLLAVAKYVGIACLIEVSAGVAMPFWGVYSTSLYQRLVPADVRAQVFAVRSLIARSAAPLGVLYATLCTGAMGIPMLFFTVGVVSLVSAACGFLWHRRGLFLRASI